MGKAFKKILKITGYVFAGVIALLIIVGVLLSVFVTKDLIVEQIEANTNARAEIAEINVPLWAALSGIEVKGFKLANRDAEMKKPVAERKPIVSETIGFESFNFKIAVGKAIMSGGSELELNSLLVRKPKARVVLYKNGGNNIVPLLIRKSAAPEPEKKEEQPAAEDTASVPFDARTLPGVIRTGKIGIEDGEFSVFAEAAGNTFILRDTDLLLKDILIDPKDLANKNQIKLELGMIAELKENKKGGVQSFRIIYDTDGIIRPFDPATGRISESVTLNLALRKGTYATGLAILEKLKKNQENLKKAGIDMSFLAETTELTEDATSTIYYNAGKITFEKPPALRTKDFLFKLTGKDYIHVKTMDHRLSGEFRLSSGHSRKVIEQLDSAIKPAVASALKAIPDQFRTAAEKGLQPDSVRDKILAGAYDKSTGELVLGILSDRLITDPSVSVTRPRFRALGEVVSEATAEAKGALKDAANAAVDAAKDKAKAEAAAQKKAAEKKAKEEAKKKAKSLKF